MQMTDNNVSQIALNDEMIARWTRLRFSEIEKRNEISRAFKTLPRNGVSQISRLSVIPGLFTVDTCQPGMIYRLGKDTATVTYTF